MTRRRWPTIGLITLLGLAAAGIAAWVNGVPADEAAILLGTALLGSGAAGVVGAMMARLFRGRPIHAQVLVVALAAVLVTVAGVVAAALAMFISAHDLTALFIVFLVAAAVAIGAAVQLGDDIDAGARQVGDFARTMVGTDGAVVTGHAPYVTGPGELTALAEELARVSRRLEESQRRERALDASRRELIAWVSHDLRAPLATIRAMAEALDDDVVEDYAAVARYHRQIRNDAERLTGLVDDLFELSRINSGVMRLGEERVGLADAVADALAGASTHAEVEGVELVERLGRLPAVEVSAREFCRALDNLLDNAIRHTPEGGRVVVEAASVDGHAVLKVSDECGGIPEPDLPRVFDVAFRGDNARGRNDGGGGLGLAIARGLVEAHAGSVSVANHPTGCVFTIRLPDGSDR
ncbi:sensor histidine kinase [Phytoactinopolyspora halotolerans]|uniref:histidine kinase n=1 Tax=Phytoactinopolyspora halotolerans TaxID=1981512 RepID=A0A6L9S1S5_9ACTN|nr:HAMP domain-containing sensor histidine kinase [Phytoactinopolyspora halotolerans]NED99454.1 HAMP domain-containing histidine kinase [Phytoactinopolyspora halotolerans]